MASVSPMVRRSVPNDNSCLFYALAYLAEGLDPSPTVERDLRNVAAEAALSDPDPETRSLFLGRPVHEYAEWIRNTHHWGGESEVLALAGHYRVEVAVVSCESMSVLVYGSGGGGATARVWVLYTGQHYDPLVGAEGQATPVSEETRRFPVGDSAETEAAALAIAKQQNEDAARRAKQRRVKRIKCGGCGALLDDPTAFQEHCGEVDHSDDFAYDCEEVEVVVEEDEELPEGSIDLTDEEKYFIFYTADATSPLSNAWAGAPFEVDGKTYRTLEHYWQSIQYATTLPDLAVKISVASTVDEARKLSNAEGMGKVRQDWDEAKPDLLLKALRCKFGSAQGNELAVSALKNTAPKTIVNIEVDPWAGMSAAGGIATGQNHVGKALEAVRSELSSPCDALLLPDN